MTAPAPVTPRLGCAETYQAEIWYWHREQQEMRFYVALTGLLEVTWERVLDDYSETRLRLRPKRGDDCCGKLAVLMNRRQEVIQAGAQVWGEELCVYRDGECVWQGPIFAIDERVQPDESTEFIQITARDFLGWVDRRTIHGDIYLNDTTYDLTHIAAEVVRSAFGPDDPDVLRHMQVSPSGKMRKWSVRYWENNAGDELRNVARLGIDFTSVGRIIIITGPNRSEPNPITLRTKDFLSGIEIRQVGAETANAGIAVGATPTGPNVDPETTPPAKAYWPPGGPAAAVDPFYGLIETWSRSESVTDQDYLEWIARQKVESGWPPPTTLSIPSRSGLNPDAPVSIHQLVPSRYFIVRVNGMCRSLEQYMRLSQVYVRWTADSPEEIGVSFIPQTVITEEGSG